MKNYLQNDAGWTIVHSVMNTAEKFLCYRRVDPNRNMIVDLH